MNLKKIAKKWGAYALGVMAVTGGMVATNVIADNGMQVSASSSENLYYVQVGYQYTNSSGEFVQNYEESFINLVGTDFLMTGFYMQATFNLENSVTYYSNKRFIVDVDNLNLNNLYVDNIPIYAGTESTTNSSALNMNFMIYSSSGKDIFDYLENDFNKNMVYSLCDLLANQLIVNEDEKIESVGNLTTVRIHEFGHHTYYPDSGMPGRSGNCLTLSHYFSSASSALRDNDFDFKVNVAIKSMDEFLNGSSGGYTEEEYLAYGEEMEFAGYQSGYADAEQNIDITTDNENAINQYITDNNMKTEEEYNAYGESQFEAGADSVDITTDNESAINQYITDNNMKTEEEYNAYGESQFEAGADSIDITSNDKAVFDKGYAEGAESVDITTDNEEVYNTAYDEGYDDNKFWKQVGRLFSNIGSLFVNAWTGVKGWFR